MVIDKNYLIFKEKKFGEDEYSAWLLEVMSQCANQDLVC